MLCELVEGIKWKNLPAMITFVDFLKAFDSIHSGKLMAILEGYGAPVEIVDGVNMMYINITAQALSLDGDTGFFEILPGVFREIL